MTVSISNLDAITRPTSASFIERQWWPDVARLTRRPRIPRATVAAEGGFSRFAARLSVGRQADRSSGRCAVEEIDRAALIDVSDEPAIEPEAAKISQPRREATGGLAWDPEDLILLLPHPARAVVHRDADAPGARPVRAPAVPEASVVDEHAAALHLGGERLGRLAEPRPAVEGVRAGHEARGSVLAREVGDR